MVNNEHAQALIYAPMH